MVKINALVVDKKILPLQIGDCSKNSKFDMSYKAITILLFDIVLNLSPRMNYCLIQPQQPVNILIHQGGHDQEGFLSPPKAAPPAASGWSRPPLGPNACRL